ncbi:MAG TPA: ABC transporter substrate-binding protein [Methylomirabilota bacterium]
MTETLEILRPLREGKVSDEDTARIFDVAVIAKRCLGRHWPDHSPAQRAEFARSLGGVLARSLGETLEDASEVRYVGQSASGPLVTVNCEVAAKGRTPAGLELRLQRLGGRWVIEDFAVNGTSFVSRYRAHLEDTLVNTPLTTTPLVNSPR